jgi:hypothetical protein
MNPALNVNRTTETLLQTFAIEVFCQGALEPKLTHYKNYLFSLCIINLY